MEKQISKGLKNLFLFHFIAGAVLGLFYLLIPEIYADIIGWPMKDVPAYRMIGAALCGFGTSSWLAYKNGIWGSVRIIVMMEIVWCGLGALVFVWSMFTEALPAIGWLNTALLLFFAVVFGYFYRCEETKG